MGLVLVLSCLTLECVEFLHVQYSWFYLLFPMWGISEQLEWIYPPLWFHTFDWFSGVCWMKSKFCLFSFNFYMSAVVWFTGFVLQLLSLSVSIFSPCQKCSLPPVTLAVIHGQAHILFKLLRLRFYLLWKPSYLIIILWLHSAKPLCADIDLNTWLNWDKTNDHKHLFEIRYTGEEALHNWGYML